ncbi:MAG: hypothetical protein ACD_38C00047G0021 [uncultured bacterium]|uniref:Uncharacterized protein n=1 Tax=Candidatus Daviesbacteria bacterium GW2011_GWC2_40_12 TaxID=1618431 RepID=A0A0G0TV99_9BACT|nr:MAG: hypothetical protein ACD_38C00047G0021 [uncultured bacterium]KKR16572.1 MAG: hypothetical protein UT45_C0005G0101 [Candidatus Daviesbacteria bacterium GW2011_GWA2_39_33]KKR41837.1 MAG: hypothetical protein UT77_C0006G0069 [Candidatus Daviesbacteria bacterium GW2011_GWC2_40_12]OGE21084.1 MAG: hypothetical protein A2778_02545 [Candidatus Daviesbacteria bacterium RIFCSPHIGHO2_01_FULL_40_24]OGE28926.1 MAG: hypothetical protein A3C29_06155 [Candidatus Daviesbacteria bacterium RIFCSPHIGHO2_02
MKRNKLIIAVAVALALFVLLTIVNSLNNGNKTLISPTLWQGGDKTVAGPESTPAINAPKEIRYDSSTDLEKELNSINPQILDEDFQF